MEIEKNSYTTNNATTIGLPVGGMHTMYISLHIHQTVLYNVYLMDK